MSGFDALDNQLLSGKACKMSNLAHIPTCFRVCPIAGA